MGWTNVATVSARGSRRRNGRWSRMSRRSSGTSDPEASAPMPKVPPVYRTKSEGPSGPIRPRTSTLLTGPRRLGRHTGPRRRRHPPDLARSERASDAAGTPVRLVGPGGTSTNASATSGAPPGDALESPWCRCHRREHSASMSGSQGLDHHAETRGTAYLLVARGGVEPPTFRFSVGRSYQLSYLAGRDDTAGSLRPHHPGATPTGLEPATSAVTGRRANQLRYGALVSQGHAYPQRDSNPCYRRERAGSWAARRWGPDLDRASRSRSAQRSDPSRTRKA